METAIISLIVSVLVAVVGWLISFNRLSNKLSFKGGTIFTRLEQAEKEIEGVKKKIGDINKEVGILHDSVLEIQTIIRNSGTELFSIIKKHSPRCLNDLGEKLFNEMHGTEFIEKNRDKLFAGIDKRQPQTALDVERVSRIVCLELANDSIFNSIKDFVYNCPMQQGKDARGNDIQIDITLDMACAILALPLRDAYLKEHPELDPNSKNRETV